MSRDLPRIGFWLLSLALIGAAAGASAQTRTEILRWEDAINPGSQVVGYRVYRGSSPGNYNTSSDVTAPALVDNAYQYSVVVQADAHVYFAVTAYNDERESSFSNEICRGPSGPCATTDPEPSPDPTPTPVEETLGAPGQPVLIMP